MYSVLNTLSEYAYLYISKNITSYFFLLVSKIVESFQCILKKYLLELIKRRSKVPEKNIARERALKFDQ